MSVTKLENGMISDMFSFDSEYGQYIDAIVIPEQEYAVLTADEIYAMKQQQFDNWVLQMKNQTLINNQQPMTE